MLALEVGQVLHVLLVCIGLAVCRQLYVVPLFGRIGLCFKWLFTGGVQLLPFVANEFGDLGKGQVLVLYFLPHPVGEYHIC
jgi:hypothetical protein